MGHIHTINNFHVLVGKQTQGFSRVKGLRPWCYDLERARTQTRGTPWMDKNYRTVHTKPQQQGEPNVTGIETATQTISKIVP